MNKSKLLSSNVNSVIKALLQTMREELFSNSVNHEIYVNISLSNSLVFTIIKIVIYIN